MRNFFLKYRLYICLFCLVLLVAFFLFFVLQKNKGNAPSLMEQKQDMKPLSPEQGMSFKKQYPPKTMPYEEHLVPSLSHLIRLADFAFIEALGNMGMHPRVMTVTKTELKDLGHEQFQYQEVTISLEEGSEEFLSVLKKALHRWVREAVLQEVQTDIWTVSIGSSLTHRVFLKDSSAPPVFALPVVPSTGKALLAIVIDDMGQSTEYAKKLAALSFPVTFSVLPGQPRSAQVAGIAKGAGLDLLLHLPMEPEGYPDINPGPYALYANMSPVELRRLIRENILRVPGVMGINNHMGSRLTSSPSAMQAVMAEIRNQRLFFLDSLTIPHSVAALEAVKAELPAYRRNIFLDNVRDVNTIIKQLQKAERIALKKKQAVVIGHPYPETLTALKKWGKERNLAVKVVPLRKIRPIKSIGADS